VVRDSNNEQRATNNEHVDDAQAKRAAALFEREQIYVGKTVLKRADAGSPGRRVVLA